LESLEEGTLQPGVNNSVRNRGSREAMNRHNGERERNTNGANEIAEILNRNGICNSTFDPSTMDRDDWGRMMGYLAGVRGSILCNQRTALHLLESLR